MASYSNFSNGSSASGDCDLNATIALHSHWIYVSFGNCVVNARQYIAVAIGLLSTLCWMVAQLPQIVENCRTGKADRSMSFWFLLFWLMSDSANFLGAVLTHQLITLVVTGAYFVFVDVVTLLQFLYHFFRNQGLKGLKKSSRTYGAVTVYVAVFILLLSPSIMSFVSISPQYHSNHDYTRKGRNLLELNEPIIDIHDKEFIVGYSFGWFSAIVYFFSVPSQIIKNFWRSSGDGLSLLFIVLITLGDSTYLLNILLFSVEKVYLIRSLPWIVGSVSSVLFDVVLLIQVICYKCIARHKSRSGYIKVLDRTNC